jgi:hypothetical protein
MGDHTDRLNEKVGLARVRVGRYLRKGESGKIEDVEAYVRRGLSVPEAHQLKIAKDTLKMPSAMQGVMGGPSPEQARKTVQRLEGKAKKTKKGDWAKPGSAEYEEEVGQFRKMLGESGGVTPITRKQTPGQRSSAQAAALRAQPSSQGKLGSTKAREEAAREYRKEKPSPTFLGHDGAGNEIREGNAARVIAGPDKGLTGIVRGIAKGGGVRIEVAGNLGKTREVLVDPDELRMKRR